MRPARPPAGWEATRFVGKGELRTCSSEKPRGAVCAEQKIGEHTIGKIHRHNQADNARFPMRRRVREPTRIDNYATLLPKVTNPPAPTLSLRLHKR